MTVTVKTDEIDRRILEILGEHPDGLRLVELSRKAEVSYSTTRYRALSLEQQGLVRVVQGRNKFKVYLK